MTTRGRCEALMRLAVGLFFACALIVAVSPAPAHSASTGSLSVHKSADPKGINSNVGAVFVVRQLLGLPLASPEELGQMVQDNPALLTSKPGMELGPEIVATTDETGTATFTGLSEGVYQVTERPQRTDNSYEDVASPFLVPVKNDVQAEISAKAQPVIVDKTVDARSVEVGAVLDYRIRTSLPPCDAQGKLHQFVVLDELDPRLAFRRLKSITVSNLNGSRTLEDGRDFRTTLDGNSVEIVMEQSGLDILAKARLGNPETRVDIHLEAEVRSSAAVGDVITNIARFSPDGYCLPHLSPSVSTLAYSDANGRRVTERVVLAAAEQCRGDQPATIQSTPAEVVVLGKDHPVDDNDDDSDGKIRPGSESHGHPDSPSSGVVDDAGNDSKGNGVGEQAKRIAGKIADNLASTGASVIGIVLAAITALVLGFILVRRRDEDDDDNEGDGRV
ncbi:isopeptide-forming domain-containing fimbrial protein [Corynebacterium sp. HMSC06G04]|uniref:isopeptide-forming domain-containing fimbrial protein n=1 Tax=Corynebacterium sp. HMSC06G04 TaxID=1581126 RepID=UPI00114C9350|nr:isopeptide-forming domain-containing fimbrial protein [Corynebacterium sp. HMSC06G04]